MRKSTDLLINDSKKLSIKEVARMAGVSPTTVSRVINNSDHPVNPETRKIVEEVIKKVNFQPNRLAQALVQNRSHLIGVIVHDISDEYFSQMVKGIDSVTSNYNYIVNICNTERSIEKELRAVNILKGHQPDAIVFISAAFLHEEYRSIMATHIEELRRQGTVVVGLNSQLFDICNIEIGHKRATKLITDYILEMGHRKIAYISGPEILTTAFLRYEGFKESVEERQIDFRDIKLIAGDYTFQSGREAVLHNLDQLHNYTAIVASTDVMALGVLWELQHQGIRVPEEISVVGIGNIPAAEYSTPPLTTVSLPVYSIGVAIGQELIHCLEEHREFSPINVEVQLVERESVKSLR